MLPATGYAEPKQNATSAPSAAARLSHRWVGLYEKALPAEWSWDQRLTAMAEAGYQYAEISIDETDERLARLDWSGREMAVLRRAIENSGVPVLTLCLSGQRRFPLGSKEETIRRQAFDLVSKAILFSVDAGVRIIQVPGYDVYFEPSDASTLARYHEGLCQVTEWAGAAGVMLALENVDVPASASLVDAMATVRHVNSPWFQIYPDMANVAAAGYDPVAELPLCKGRMVAVHVKDALPRLIRGVPFEAGIVPFLPVFRALAQCEYRGPLTIEMWAHMDPTGKPFESVIAARQLVADLLTTTYTGQDQPC